MSKSGAQRSMEYRRRKGIEPRKLEPHGTRAGAARERRAGQKPCVLCAAAEREYIAAAARNRRAVR